MTTAIGAHLDRLVSLTDGSVSATIPLDPLTTAPDSPWSAIEGLKAPQSVRCTEIATETRKESATTASSGDGSCTGCRNLVIDAARMTAASPRLDAGFAEVNGTRLYYEACGGGPALLFLHGFTLDHRMWRAQVEGLSDRYRVITYDARGFGRSAMPGSDPYLHSEDAASLCEHLGIDRVVAVGHSIGGHQTLELAMTRPDLVAGWVSVCTAGLAGLAFPKDIVEMFGALRKTAGEEGPEAAKRIWAGCRWFASAREIPNVARQLDAMLDDYSGWHWTHDNPAVNLKPPAADRLGEVRVPSLVVTGGRDLEYNDAVGAALVEGIRGARALRLPFAGHMANMEDPASVNRAVADLADRALFALSPGP